MKAEVKRVPLGVGPRVFATTDPSHTGVLSWSQQFFVDSPYVRNFVVAASEVFITVQKECASFYPEPVPQNIINSLSRMYRGFLLELCQALKDAGDSEGADLYSNLDFVWNFCEIMFLSSHPDLPILPYLLDWIRINFDQSSDLLPSIMEELPLLSASSTENLWTLIYSHTFHGATQEASRLLQFTNTQPDQMDLMSELLVKKPEFYPESGSTTEFESMFTAWQEECRNRLENGAFDGNEHYTFICKVLCGDEEAFGESLSKNILNWYEYLVMTLNYKYPTIRPSLLKVYAAQTLKEIGMENIESRDMILLHAMDYNIVGLLKEISSVWDNPWFSLHFLDLVNACGRGTNEEESAGDYTLVSPLRKYFIKEYGSEMMEHPTLWQMGIYYLESLEAQEGHPIIRECLGRRKPENEIEAHKLLQIAEKFGFGEEIRSICRQVSLSKLSMGQEQNALLWAIKAGDGALTTKIVDSILFEGDCEVESTLLDSLNNIIPCANSIIFLQCFCEFRKSMTSKNYKEGVKNLCVLIQNNLIPRRIAHKILLKNKEILSKGEYFEPGEATILLEFIHTKIPPHRLSPAEFKALNESLMKVRAYEIVSKFKKT